jgi:putative spermidine/putrescine transport system ATP-binding protein
MLIRDIQKKMGITTIFVTHDQMEALVMSDRIVIINAGAIMQYGTSEQIYHKPRNKFVADFIGTYNFLSSKFVGFDDRDNEVCIRPEHIQLVKKDELALNTDPEIFKLQGILKSYYILGNTVRAEVIVQGKTIIVDDLNKFALTHFAEKEEVGLQIEKTVCTVLDSN